MFYQAFLKFLFLCVFNYQNLKRIRRMLYIGISTGYYNTNHILLVFTSELIIYLLNRKTIFLLNYYIFEAVSLFYYIINIINFPL